MRVLLQVYVCEMDAYLNELGVATASGSKFKGVTCFALGFVWCRGIVGHNAFYWMSKTKLY